MINSGNTLQKYRCGNLNLVGVNFLYKLHSLQNNDKIQYLIVIIDDMVVQCIERLVPAAILQI